MWNWGLLPTTLGLGHKAIAVNDSESYKGTGTLRGFSAPWDALFLRVYRNRVHYPWALFSVDKENLRIYVIAMSSLRGWITWLLLTFCYLDHFVGLEDLLSQRILFLLLAENPQKSRHLWDSFAKKAVGPKVMALPSSPHPVIDYEWCGVQAIYYTSGGFWRLSFSSDVPSGGWRSTNTALPLDFLLSLAHILLISATGIASSNTPCIFVPTQSLLPGKLMQGQRFLGIF